MDTRIISFTSEIELIPVLFCKKKKFLLFVSIVILKINVTFEFCIFWTCSFCDKHDNHW